MESVRILNLLESLCGETLHIESTLMGIIESTLYAIRVCFVYRFKKEENNEVIAIAIAVSVVIDANIRT